MSKGEERVELRNRPDLNRRDFHKLVATAFGGLVGGSLVSQAFGASPQAAKKEHVCCGLNQCKGLGADGKNACAGQGTCATVKAHSCKGQNDCAGEGGCGAKPGANACKGQGGCEVPVEMENAWKAARNNLQAAMKKAGKTLGPKPANCPKKG
jgi:hypothetical protein